MAEEKRVNSQSMVESYKPGTQNYKMRTDKEDSLAVQGELLKKRLEKKLQEKRMRQKQVQQYTEQPTNTLKQTPSQSQAVSKRINPEKCRTAQKNSAKRDIGKNNVEEVRGLEQMDKYMSRQSKQEYVHNVQRSAPPMQVLGTKKSQSQARPITKSGVQSQGSNKINPI